MNSDFLSGFRIQKLAITRNTKVNIESANGHSSRRTAPTAPSRLGDATAPVSEDRERAIVDPREKIDDPAGPGVDLGGREPQLNEIRGDPHAARRIQRSTCVDRIQHPHRVALE